MTRQRQAALAGLILLLALVARGGVVLFRSFEPIHDAEEYDETAVALALGEGWPDSRIAPAGGAAAFHPPLYHLFLAGVYRLSGSAGTTSRWTWGLIAQAVLGTIGVGLMGGLAWVATRRQVTALLALAMAAVYPPLITWSSSLLVEPLFIVLATSATIATLQFRRAPPNRLHWAIAAGVLIGLAALTRSNGFVLAIPLAFGVWKGRPRFALRSLIAPAAFSFAVLVTISPWVVRNTIEFDEFVPLGTELGYILGSVYNSNSQTMAFCPSCYVPRLAPEFGLDEVFATFTEADANRALTKAALGYIADHPLSPLITAGRNTRRLFGLEGVWFEQFWGGGYGFGTKLSTASILGWYAAALLVLAGLASRSVRAKAREVPAFVWAIPIVIHVSGAFTNLEPRYRTLMAPVLLLFGAIVVSALWDRYAHPTPVQP